MKHALRLERVKRSLAAALPVTLAVLMLGRPALAQEDDIENAPSAVKPVRKVSPELLVTGGGIDFDAAIAVFNQAFLRDGNIKSVLAQLDIYANDARRPARQRSNAMLLASHLQWNGGELAAALQSIDKAIKADASNADALLLHACMQEANGNASGARDTYLRALPLLSKQEDKDKAQLRLTLIEVDEKNIRALTDLAGKRDKDFSNRAAVALAVLGHYKDATALYQPAGERSDLFRQHLRMAQWAVQAGDAATAQREAWTASQLAELQRDVRYSLSVAVDAYELDNALDKLLQRLSQKGKLNEDEQNTRIEILRKLRRYEEAIQLFLSANSTEMSPDTQRQLLRMYRDAGRDKETIDEYRKLIARDPQQTVWYEGLSQFLLEKNEHEAAKKVWSDFLARNADDGALLAGAKSMVQFGFEDLAMEASEKCIANGDAESTTAALAFRFKLSKRRSRVAEAEQILQRLEGLLPAESLQRIQLADFYDQLGKRREALTVLEQLQKRLPEGLGFDQKMRMAFLYDATGQRDKALDVWQMLWGADVSPARRSLVEDRMLLLAGETGTLGEIAARLEQKLKQGKATEKDSTLLIRIYLEARDVAAAIEIVQTNFNKKDALNSVESLKEQAKVFQKLDRFAAHEKTLERLIALDPDNSVEYLQSLIMNAMEGHRGKEDDPEEEIQKHNLKLQRLLARLHEVGGEAAGSEFQAGIMEMAGFDQKAIEIYQRAVAENPGHTDNYLLLGNILKRNLRLAEAVAMLQYQTEAAQRDDAFIVAVDGVLNLNPKSALTAQTIGQPTTVSWLRRRTLERLTGRADKLYLYEVLAELAESDGDIEAYLSALENSLAYANSRRSTVLRELITATSQYNGRMRRGITKPDVKRSMSFSRRLISLGEELPPEIYLNVGKMFLKVDDVGSAMDAFNMALDRTGKLSLVEETGDLLYNANYRQQAAGQYERALIVDAESISLMYKLGNVRDTQGLSEDANKLYLRALRNVLGSQLLEVEGEGRREPPPLQNVLKEDYKLYYWPLVAGFVRTLPMQTIAADGAADSVSQFQAIEQLFTQTLQDIAAHDGKPKYDALGFYPRMQIVAEFARTVAFRSGHYEFAEKLDGMLLRHFERDAEFVKDLVQQRLSWGFRASAERIVAQVKEASPRTVAGLEVLLGVGQSSELALSPAIVKSALDKKEYQKAIGVAAMLNDRDSIVSAYLEWFREALLNGKPYVLSYGDVLYDAYTRLDPQAYAAVCNEVLNMATMREDYSKKLLNESYRLNFIHGGTVAKAEDTSWLLSMEKATGKTFFTEAQVLELTQPPSHEGLDMAYVMFRLSQEKRVQFLERYLESAEPLILSRSWPKVFAALNIMLREPVNGGLSNRIGAALRAAVDKSLGSKNNMDGMDSLHYAEAVAQKWYDYRFTQNVHRSNVTWIENLERDLVNAYPKQLSAGILTAGLFVDAGKAEQALPLLAGNLVRIAGFKQIGEGSRSKVDPPPTHPMVQYLKRYQEAIYPRYHKKLLYLAELQERGGLTPELFSAQNAILEANPQGTEAEALRWLRAKAVAHPDSEMVLNQLALAYARLGYADEEIKLLDRLVELAPLNSAYRWRLFRLWHQFGNPEKALIAVAGRLTDILGLQDKDADTYERMLGREFSDAVPYQDGLKKMVAQAAAINKGGSVADAKVAVRSLLQALPAWRDTEMGAGGWVARVVSNPQPMDTLPYTSWVQMKADFSLQEDEKQTVAPLQPGLRLSDSLAEVMRDDAGNAAKGRSATLLETLPQHEFFIAELEALIRTMEPGNINQQYRIYEALAAAYQANEKLSGELDRLSRAIQAGRADSRLVTLWLVLLSKQPQAITQDAMRLIDERVLALGLPNQYQKVVLARVFAKAGHFDRAIEFYNTAVLAIFSGLNERDRSPEAHDQGAGLEQTPLFFTSVLGLHQDAIRYLDGDSKLKFVKELLKSVKLSNGPAAGYDSGYALLVMAMLRNDMSSALLRTELQDIAAADEKSAFLSSAAALQMCGLQVRLGLNGQALKSLQKGLQNVAAANGFNPNLGLGYGESYPLDHYWNFNLKFKGQQSPIKSLLAFKPLFVGEAGSEDSLRQWSAQVAAAVPQWIEQGTVPAEDGLLLMTFVTRRQLQLGFAGDARLSAQALAKIIAPPREFAFHSATLAVSVITEAGVATPFDTLQALVHKKRITPEQLALAMQRLAKTDGADDEAVNLGELMATYSQNDELLGELKTLCSQTGAAGKATQWSDLVQRAAQARHKIERGEDIKPREALIKQDLTPDPDAGLSYDFKFTALGGREVDTAQLRGKVVLVDFWATWCFGCTLEIPNIRQVYNRYKDKGFEVISVSLDRYKDDLADFSIENDVTWPHYFDGKGWQNAVYLDFNSKLKDKLNGIPAPVLFDQEGKLVTKKARGELLEIEVKRLLGISNADELSMRDEVLPDPDRGMQFDLKFQALNGSAVDMAKLRGKIVLLNFWSTDSLPSKMQLRHIKRVYETYKDRGLEVVGVSLDRDKGALSEYCIEQDIVWPQYFDGKGYNTQLLADFNARANQKLAEPYGLFLLDKEGKLVTRRALGEGLEAEVRRLLEIK